MGNLSTYMGRSKNKPHGHVWTCIQTILLHNSHAFYPPRPQLGSSLTGGWQILLLFCFRALKHGAHLRYREAGPSNFSRPCVATEEAKTGWWVPLCYIGTWEGHLLVLWNGTLKSSYIVSWSYYKIGLGDQWVKAPATKPNDLILRQDSWDLLASQFTLFGEHQAKKQPCVIKARWMSPQGGYPTFISGLHRHAHAHTHAQAPEHMWTHSCTHVNKKWTLKSGMIVVLHCPASRIKTQQPGPSSPFFRTPLTTCLSSQKCCSCCPVLLLYWIKHFLGVCICLT